MKTNGEIMRLTLITIFIVTVLNSALADQYFVAPDGDDSNPGTIDQPVESIQKAQTFVSPGDTVFIRGGIYSVREEQISSVQQNLFACVSYLNKSGLPGQTIKYWAYPGEQPVFDYSAVKPANQRVVGIWMAGSYIHLKGLEMTGIQVTITTHTESYCIYSRGNNNIYEQISMHDNVGTGLRHYKGGGNLFLNCDSYRNWDNVSEDGLGSNCDGFGCHPDPGGTGNVFRGCRAWFNSDDGFDIIRADESVVFDHCWAFYNGFSTSFQSLGDGNGFKAGGYAHDTADQIPNPVPRNTIQFCIAVRNKANGFYSNHHLAGNDWYNNSAYLNLTNFNMLNRPSRDDADNIDGDGYDHVLKNNLSYQKGLVYKHTAYIDTAQNTSVFNSFDLPITLSDDDFVSLDMELLTSPRKEDGSLPDINFMRPAAGSAIDAGIDIGFEFLGKAPELGAFEVESTSAVEHSEEIIPGSITLFQNYPNPFNPKTTIHYALSEPGDVTVSVYNFLGQKVCTLVKQYQHSGEFNVLWNGKNDSGKLMASGIYFYRLSITNSSGSFMVQKKMLLLK